MSGAVARDLTVGRFIDDAAPPSLPPPEPQQVEPGCRLANNDVTKVSRWLTGAVLAVLAKFSLLLIHAFRRNPHKRDYHLCSLV